MASHSYHPDSHEFGLADDCEQCARHAERPIESLDAPNLYALLDRIYHEQEPRSNNEAIAMKNIRAHLVREDRLQRLQEARRLAESEEGNQP